MELERMPPGPETSRRAASSSSSSAQRRAISANANTANNANANNSKAPPMEHLNLSLPLHVQVPPLPSPNTTAAAAALFRVNQLPPAASPTVGVFSFSKAATTAKRLRDDAHPHHHLQQLQLPTPTTAAAAAAAMALSASSPASAASAASAAVDEHNKTASLMSESNRRRKVGIPKFLRFLFQMLEYEDQDVIAWSHDGTAFQIRDPDELAERVLPKYFKHNKVSSFQRQLNYFGFKKWTKTQTNICTFSHPCFVRDEQENMRLIKRKERSTRSGGGASGGAAKHGEQEDEAEEDVEQEEPDADALSDEQDAHQQKHARPAKRAKVQTAATGKQQRQTSAAGRRAAAAAKQEPKTKAASASKPPRVKKSPRGGRGTSAGSARGLEEAPEEQQDGDEASSGRGRKLQLPTISPASSASTLTSSSFSRPFSHSGDGSPTAQSYSRGDDDGGGGSDAAPVMPIHADMMMQQYARRLPGGGAGNGSGSIYDGPMQDLAESFGQSAWQSSYGLSSFKFSDPAALESSFDMGNGSGVGGGGCAPGAGNGSSGGYGAAPQGMTNTKDYLDVLLESANMDDQISAQSSVGSSDSGLWDAAYRSGQQHQHPHQLYGHQAREPTHPSDRRMSAEAAIATYNMLSAAQAQHSDNGTAGGQMGMQLPSIEDLQGMRY